MKQKAQNSLGAMGDSKQPQNQARLHSPSTPFTSVGRVDESPPPPARVGTLCVLQRFGQGRQAALLFASSNPSPHLPNPNTKQPDRNKNKKYIRGDDEDQIKTAA